MKVYLAARYSRRDELREYRSLLNEQGIEVTSRWLDETGSLDGDMTSNTDEFYIKTAKIDIDDVTSADAVIFFAEDPLEGVPRGGRHVEFGYAWALGKKIYVVGFKENVFHYLENVYHFDSLQQVIESIVPVGV